MTTSYDIAVIAGDGIGPEVTTEALKVADAAAEAYGFSLVKNEYDLGTERWLKTGDIFPDADFEDVKGHNAIYLGAIGDPRAPVGLIEYGIIAKCRFDLDLYINLRPIKLYDERMCPLKDKGPKDIDMLIIRENTEDLYAGLEYHPVPADLRGVLSDHPRWAPFADLDAEDVALSLRVTTRAGCERILHAAFEFARRTGRRAVTVVEKPNMGTSSTTTLLRAPSTGPNALRCQPSAPRNASCGKSGWARCTQTPRSRTASVKVAAP